MDSEKDTAGALGLTQGDLESLFESTFNDLQKETPKNTAEYRPKTPFFEPSFSDPQFADARASDIGSEIENLKPGKGLSRSKTSLRMKYEAEVLAFTKDHGDLESIRRQLGLSKRKMAQLLLVDPSAWTRWTSKGGEAPPHIFRALQWYLLLQEKHPEYKSSLWLNAVSQPQMHPKEIENIKNQVIDSAKTRLFEFDEQLRDEHFSEKRKMQNEVQKAHEKVNRLSLTLKKLLMVQIATLAALVVTAIFF